MNRHQGSAIAAFVLLAACSRDLREIAPPPDDQPVVAEKPQEEPRRLPQDQQDYFRRPAYTSNRVVHLDVGNAQVGRGGVSLWYTPDDGRTWIDHAFHEGRPTAVGFTAPREGKFGVVLVPVDQEGRRDFIPNQSTKPDVVVVYDATPPSVEVLAPNGGEILGGGKTTEIAWIAEDANLAPAPIALMVSQDGGVNWTEIDRDLPNTGRHRWTTPGESGAAFRVRVVARDLADNAGADASDANFTVDADAPELQIMGPPTATRLPVQIQYRVVEVGGSDVTRVRVFVTADDGVSWTELDNDDLSSPFEFTALNGRYGLWLAADDAVGNRGATPVPGAKPKATLVIDTTPPALTLVEPARDIYLGGRPLEIRWVARDNIDIPQRSISIYSSDDGGRSWRVIAEGVSNNGLYTWDAPGAGGRGYHIKLVARDTLGNTNEAISRPFALDVNIPEAIATTRGLSRSTVVDVGFELRKIGFSPISRVTLFYRPAGQKAWTRYGDDADMRSPITFSQADGDYELYVVAVTELGIETGERQRDPNEGDAPQATVSIDATPPALALRSFDEGGVFAAGSTQQILWDVTESHPLADGMTIDYSPDGTTWSEVAARVDPSSGRFDWTVPDVFGRAHRLRLTCVDAFGNQTVVQSARPFIVDRDAPQITANAEAMPAYVRTRGVEIPYEATDDLPSIDRVEAFARTEGTEYAQVATSRSARGTMRVELPRDGRWEIKLTAVDSVGRRSSSPSVGVTVDTQPPTVTITRRADEQTGATWYVDEFGDLNWIASDEFTRLEEITLRVRFAGEDGIWMLGEENVRNTGRTSTRNYLQPGKTYRVELVARDRAGNEAVDQTPAFTLPLPAKTEFLGFRLTRAGEEGEIHPDESVAFAWDLAQVGERLLEVEFQVRAPGRDWETEQRLLPHELNTSVVTRDVVGLHAVRLRGRDGYGRTIFSNVVEFRVEELPVPAVALEITPAQTTYRIGEEVIVRWTTVPPQEVREARLERRFTVGDPWQRVAVDISGGQGAVVLPTDPTAVYFRVAIKDRKDRWGFSEEKRVQTRIAAVPQVFLSADPQDFADAGDPLRIGWDVREGDVDQVKSMRLEMRLTGDSTWRTVRTLVLSDPAVSVTAPEIAGSYEYRLYGTDTSNREIVSPVLLMQVKHKPYLVAATLEGEYERQPGWPVTVHFEAPGRDVDPGQVTVVIRRSDQDLGAAVPTVTANTRQVVFNAPGEPGTYFFRVRLHGAGAVGETREMELFVTRPDTPSGDPKITLLNFRGGQTVGGGSQQMVMAKLDGAVVMGAVNMLLSRDAGKTWELVDERSIRRTPEYLHWSVPLETGRAFRLRLQWGANAQVGSESDTNFTIESRPPRVTLTAPPWTAGRDVPLDVHIEPREDKVRATEVYYSMTGGMQWLKQPGEILAGEPVVFHAPEARKYDVYVVVTTELGLSNTPPANNTPPMATVTTGGEATPPTPEPPKTKTRVTKDPD